MTDEQWIDLDEKALSVIQLCLKREILREVIHESIAVGLWAKLESHYMTKSLANKLRLKERLYALRMKEGTEIQSHLSEFSSILLDLENLEITIEDEDKTILLLVSLPDSFKHFKEIMLYINTDSLCFEDVKANLLSKEKFDSEKHPKNNAEGLNIRVRSSDKKLDDNSSKSRSKSKNRFKNGFKSCKYCKKSGHEISECFKLKNKKEKMKKDKSIDNKESDETSYVNTCHDGNLLLVGNDQKSMNEWILDSGCTYHMCPHKHWFTSYEDVDGCSVIIGNSTPCTVVGKGSIQIKTHDGVIRTLTGVRHIPELKRNLISLGTLESKGCRYSVEGGVLKVLKGS